MIEDLIKSKKSEEMKILTDEANEIDELASVFRQWPIN